MEMAKKHKDALQSCEQRPHNLPIVEASNAQEKKVRWGGGVIINVPSHSH